MFKLIACDLDDTLLRNDFSVSENNKRAIDEVKKKGIKVVILTGRVTAAVKPFIHELGLDEPFGSFQGAKITDPKTDEILYSCQLEKDVILDILKYAEKNDIHVNIYDDKRIYVRCLNKWSDFYKGFARKVDIVEVGSLQDYEFKETPKIVFIDENEKLIKAYDDILKFKSDDINMFFSKKNFLEFTKKDATKGHALKFLADKWHIERHEIMAIGDNYNDLTMIEYAGLGICMENGEENVKRRSDFVTLSNENDGVAYALDKLILKTQNPAK
ncbi:MAG: Cof-type HAD-IIB family hydrolase [Eubacteriales bacterium]|nr:Cof-type HAD-IIB family hydrolase [Eubacteriales bacterium]